MAKRRKKLGALSIAMANLSGQGLRTAVMELLCFILAASIFASSILLASLERGVEQTVNRLGADVIVVRGSSPRNTRHRSSRASIAASTSTARGSAASLRWRASRRRRRSSSLRRSTLRAVPSRFR